jgi:hypothetical protein
LAVAHWWVGALGVPLSERFVRWLERACNVFDTLPWIIKEGDMWIWYGIQLGDVWQHPFSKLSQFLDARWDTGVWTTEEGS